MLLPRTTAAVFAALASTCSAYTIKVAASGGNKTTRTHYGLMHEDINNSGDGGIYAELIQNRAFQGTDAWPKNMSHYFPIGGASLALNNHTNPLSKALTTSLKVTGTSKTTGFYNDGFWGMDVKVQRYTGSFWVLGAYTGSFTASLRSNLTDDVFGSVQIPSQAKASEWVEHKFELTPTRNAPNSNNTFALTFDAAGVESGSLDINLISLFPPTWKNRPNGLRIDLAEAYAALKPTIFRFPGGNMLEGNTIDHPWRWQETIGPLKDRPGHPGAWGYFVSNGLGLVEYMQWAEDLGTEVVLAVYAGLALDGSFVAEDDIHIWVQDALDELEFLMGDVTTKWGAVRASLGHPKGWADLIKYVEIGNEDWLAGRPEGWESYKNYRFPAFMKAINAKYPNITVLASGDQTKPNFTVPAGAGQDHHPFLYPDQFVERFGYLDNWEAPTLLGEIASVHPNGGLAWAVDKLHPFPWWIGSIGEAIFLLGAERNSDHVIGATYAPGMRNMNAWHWSMTMLQHAADPALTTLSTSYHTWQLLGAHSLTHTLPSTSDQGDGPLYYVTGKNENTGAHIFKGAVYNSTADVPVSVTFESVKPGAQAALTMLTNPSGDPYAYNDPFTRVNIVDKKSRILTAGPDGAFNFTMPALSLAVLDTSITQCKKRKVKKALTV